MKNTMKSTKDLIVEEVKYVSVTQIIPENWESWFYSDLSSGSSLTWGDSNLTLIDADRIIYEVEEMIMEEDTENQRESVIETLKYLSENNIYIDLES